MEYGLWPEFSLPLCFRPSHLVHTAVFGSLCFLHGHTDTGRWTICCLISKCKNFSKIFQFLSHNSLLPKTVICTKIKAPNVPLLTNRNQKDWLSFQIHRGKGRNKNSQKIKGTAKTVYDSVSDKVWRITVQKRYF